MESVLLVEFSGLGYCGLVDTIQHGLGKEFGFFSGYCTCVIQPLNNGYGLAIVGGYGQVFHFYILMS